ncbi:hypothetical protein [Levilactobacillus sp. HBUAS70063]|uniref:hypothetical protein n=1 Tax=Levilactobacillus sp. HBUAS70063 TaxID=3109359 RepID=UPI00313338BA
MSRHEAFEDLPRRKQEILVMPEIIKSLRKLIWSPNASYTWSQLWRLNAMTSLRMSTNSMMTHCSRQLIFKRLMISINGDLTKNNPATNYFGCRAILDLPYFTLESMY